MQQARSSHPGRVHEGEPRTPQEIRAHRADEPAPEGGQRGSDGRAERRETEESEERRRGAGQNAQDAQDGPDGLEDMLDRIEALTEGAERVSVGEVVEEIGSHSFGPLILLPGLIMVVPGFGDIPGVPVLMGVFVILVGVQHLLRRDHLWIPGWLARRSVRARLIEKSVNWSRKPARLVDRWTRRRLTWAVRHAGFVVIAAACLLIAAATPLMEVVPFSAALAGTVLTAFGVALLAMGLTIGTGVLIAWQLI